MEEWQGDQTVWESGSSKPFKIKESLTVRVSSLLPKNIPGHPLTNIQAPWSGRPKSGRNCSLLSRLLARRLIKCEIECRVSQQLKLRGQATRQRLFWKAEIPLSNVTDKWLMSFTVFLTFPFPCPWKCRKTTVCFFLCIFSCAFFGWFTSSDNVIYITGVEITPNWKTAITNNQRLTSRHRLNSYSEVRKEDCSKLFIPMF